MAEILSDDAIRWLNVMGSQSAAQATAAAAAAAQRASDEAEAAAARARTQPLEDAVQTVATQLDVELQAVYSSDEFRTAQEVVRKTHGALSAAATEAERSLRTTVKDLDARQAAVTEAIAAEQAAYDAAVAERDALTAKAREEYAAAIVKPLADLDAERAAIAAEKVG